jgi:hypothetical protein
MSAKISVSIGELLDKISILMIKSEKFNSPEKIKNVNIELNLLVDVVKQKSIDLNTDLFQELKTVNLSLWNIEDEIRKKESKKEFDEEFIKLARSVYINNDQRAKIKKDLNIKYSSELIEEKEYETY